MPTCAGKMRVRAAYLPHAQHPWPPVRCACARQCACNCRSRLSSPATPLRARRSSALMDASGSCMVTAPPPHACNRMPLPRGAAFSLPKQASLPPAALLPAGASGCLRSRLSSSASRRSSSVQRPCRHAFMPWVVFRQVCQAVIFHASAPCWLLRCPPCMQCLP